MTDEPSPHGRNPAVLAVLTGTVAVFVVGVVALYLAFAADDGASAAPRAIRASQPAPAPLVLPSASTVFASVASPNPTATFIEPVDPAATTSPSPGGTAVTLSADPIGRREGGNGSGTLSVATEVAGRLVTLTHTGPGRFTAVTLDRQGVELDRLVSTTGDYRGTMMLDVESGEPAASLRIETDRVWTATITSLTAAPVWNGPVLRGSGTRVFRLDRRVSRSTVVHAVHPGAGTFSVRVHGRSRSTYPDKPEVPVDTEGAYSGDFRLQPGSGWVEIRADGDWTLTRPA
ncbi:hypothetical protein [Microbispora sp. NBC_01389]|uniref:hypothetical protein n=1 Tax=Microbispora sp. NBC_01389 TaxID=2903584 RepID=UPI003252FFA0